MSEPASLSLQAAAVRLLLEVLELPEPVLAAAAIQHEPELADELTTHTLLVHHDFEEVTASTADDSDVPVALNWSERSGTLSYFSGSAGHTLVEKESIRRWRVDFDAVLAAATAALDLQKADRPFELVESLLWEVGAVKLDRRRPRTPIWFARRLWDVSVRQDVQEAARRRPHLQQRLLLTSSRSERIGTVHIPGFVTVALEDVIARPTSLAVDADILAARLTQAPSTGVSGPIALSPDGRQLRINGGAPLAFRSAAHIAAIERLVKAYQTGQRVRATELTHHGSLSRLFGAKRWSELMPYLKSINGLWGFEP